MINKGHNADQFDDLKQFIDTRISQSDTNSKEILEDLRKEMNAGLTGIAEAIDEVNKQVEDRLTRLEQTLIKLRRIDVPMDR